MMPSLEDTMLEEATDANQDIQFKSINKTQTDAVEESMLSEENQNAVTPEQVSKTIQIKALGPATEPYLSYAESFAKSVKRQKIEIVAPKLKSEARWTSVIVSVTADIKATTIEKLTANLSLLHEAEIDNKPDLSIHIDQESKFYTLPADQDKFIAHYRAITSGK